MTSKLAGSMPGTLKNRFLETDTIHGKSVQILCLVEEDGPNRVLGIFLIENGV